MTTESMDRALAVGQIALTTDMPQGNLETESQQSIDSTATYNNSVKSHVNFDSSQSNYTTQYHGAEAWWSVGEFLQQGITHQSVGLSLQSKQDEEVWDLSDSLADLYQMVNEREKKESDHLSSDLEDLKAEVDRRWIEKDTCNGFVRVFNSDSEVSKLVPCTLSTSAHKVCLQCGRPPNSLHIQPNGDIIRRLEPFDCPLAIQNEYLQRIGYSEIRKIQEMGSSEDLCWLVKFYAGKPISDSTYSRHQLQTYAYVRKGKLIYQWVRRLCVISGTRLLIYRDKNKSSKPTTVQLAKGSVDEVSFKGHDKCLRLTSKLQGDRSVYLSFAESSDYSKWIRKAKKATAKLPTKADLTNCHLEFLPETVFINEDLKVLNLRHNALKERPIEEDIYTIGWLDDLARFFSLSSLNLADNDLHTFPAAVCKIKTLVELNISSNKISEIPPEISELTSLKMLHLHNNYLSSVPAELAEMKSLNVIVLAFNHFTSVPEVLLHVNSSQLQLDSIIMAGNRVERLPHETLCKMQHIKKIDLRMNNLLLLPSETAKFHFLELVTHMDLRDNQIKNLDVRALKALEYLNCERNGMHTLQINGMSLKTLLANDNELEVFTINPKPEWLVSLEISRNKLIKLPTWVSECFFMVKLDASHNRIQDLPNRLFIDAQKLKVLSMNHNLIHDLPGEVSKCMIEEIHLEHNNLTMLPGHLMLKASKLRYLNLTQNNIAVVPQFSFTHDSRLQELFLSGNKLEDDSVPFLCSFTRLKVLHIAHNRLTEIKSRDISKLEMLQELNASDNDLRSLPSCLGKHSKLQVLRANSNHLKELPDFKRAANLKILEVGSNRLSEVSLTHLMASQVNLLDISGNPNIMVNSSELKGISNWKKICTVDMRGQNRSLLDLRQAPFESGGSPWQTGLSLTSGMRNKLSVAIMNKPHFTNDGEGLFGVFDGGRNDEVNKILMDCFPDILLAESQNCSSGNQYMKYSFLSAHSKLKDTGQKLSAAAAVCHLRKSKDGSHYVLNVANVGDAEIVLSRRGEAVTVSRRFHVLSDHDECRRVCKSHGIITEDGKVNGVTHQTRSLGNSFLYPHVIPNPQVTSINLHPDDQMIIIANHGLWNYISYEDAVKEINSIPDPVVAAKRLQDLAQGYGSRESIGVLVIRLVLSESERNRLKNILKKQYNAEQELLAAIKERDMIREEEKKKRRDAVMQEEEMVPMDIVKLKKQTKKRMQAYDVFHEDAGDYVDLSLNPENNSLTWEVILQKRLTEEIKNRELMHIFSEEDKDLMNAAFEMGYNGVDMDTNWATYENEKSSKSKSRKKAPEKEISRTPAANSSIIAPEHYRPQSLIGNSPSLESVEFTKEYKMPMNVDRDAVLFHQMQIDRSKSKSTVSIDSTQSVPNVGSYKEIPVVSNSSSHSIEVLFHKPENFVDDYIGGSHLSPLNKKKIKVGTKEDEEVGNSCPEYTGTDSVILQKLERTIGAIVTCDSDDEESYSDRSERTYRDNENNMPNNESLKHNDIIEDTSIVSAYKTSPTFHEKKTRAPQPPGQKLSPNRSQYQKEKRAPPPPPPGPCNGVVLKDNSVSYPQKFDMSSVSDADKQIDLSRKPMKGDVSNIRATVSSNTNIDKLSDVSSNDSSIRVNSKNTDNRQEVISQTFTPTGSMNQVPDVISSSVTSLEKFYYNMGGQRTIGNTVRNSQSMEPLIQLSLSQQSVIETYL